MTNPSDLYKIMGDWGKFANAHPKFVNFMNVVMAQGIDEGDVIEITVTKKDAEPITANMRVTADDIDIINDLKSLR